MAEERLDEGSIVTNRLATGGDVEVFFRVRAGFRRGVVRRDKQRVGGPREREKCEEIIFGVVAKFGLEAKVMKQDVGFEGVLRGRQAEGEITAVPQVLGMGLDVAVEVGLHAGPQFG